MCVALEEGGDEWTFGLRREFCLLCMYRDVGKALPEISKENKIASSILSWQRRWQPKHPEQDPSRVQCCCLDVRRAGPRGWLPLAQC